MQANLKNTQNKLKLMLLITKSNFGGAQKYVFDIASAESVKNDHEISVALGGDGELVDRLEQNNIKVFKLKTLSNSLNPIKLLKQIIEIRKLLKIQKPDILHMNSNMASLAGILATVFLSKKPKTIFTGHGWPFNENRSTLQKTILKSAISIIVLLSDITICVSKKTRDQLPKLIRKLKSRSLFIIYNGIDYVIKNENKILFRDLYNSNTVHLVSVGELHHIKGHDMVIRAIADINKKRNNINISNNSSNTNNSNYVYNNDNLNKKYHYHILGDGNYRKDLEELIKENEQEKNVTLHGYIKDAKEYIHQFDIFIMPSRSEAMGYAIVEAYTSGLPMILTDVGGISEVRESATYGELVKPNVENIKNILQNYLDNPEKLNRREGELVFKKQDMINQTLDIYKM